jgi:hypothetical protein
MSPYQPGQTTLPAQAPSLYSPAPVAQQPFPPSYSVATPAQAVAGAAKTPVAPPSTFPGRPEYPGSNAAPAMARDGRPTMYGFQGMESRYAGLGWNKDDVSAVLRANAEARGYNYVEVPVSGDDKKGQADWVKAKFKDGDGAAGISAGTYTIRNLAKDGVKFSSVVGVGAQGDVTKKDFPGVKDVSIDPEHSLEALQRQAVGQPPHQMTLPQRRPGVASPDMVADVLAGSPNPGADAIAPRPTPRPSLDPFGSAPAVR